MRRAALVLTIAGAITPGLAFGQTLDARQTRALDCAAIFYSGADALQKAGKIDAATAKTVQEVGKAFLKEVPGRRKAKTALVNERIKAMSKGKSREQLLLEFGKRQKPCETEFPNAVRG